MTFEYLQHLVLKWSHDRRIIEHSTSTAKLLKTVAAKGRAIGIEWRDGKERHTKAATEHQ